MFACTEDASNNLAYWFQMSGSMNGGHIIDKRKSVGPSDYGNCGNWALRQEVFRWPMPQLAEKNGIAQHPEIDLQVATGPDRRTRNTWKEQCSIVWDHTVPFSAIGNSSIVESWIMLQPYQYLMPRDRLKNPNLLKFKTIWETGWVIQQRSKTMTMDWNQTNRWII